MNCITIRFYGDLNYFVDSDQKRQDIVHYFNGKTSVKDIIESLGVPHTEADLILINGEAVDFSHLIHGGERISVYPLFRSLDVSSLTMVRPVPLADIRFVLDVHLGKLAKYLRLIGFDTIYYNDASDEKLADISSEQDRILLTFDRGLLMRKKVNYGYCVRSRDPFLQLVEVIGRFELMEKLKPFSRCIHCNTPLKSVSKEEVLPRLPDFIRETLDEFYICQVCDRVYWKGTHYEGMKELIKQVEEYRP